MKRIIWLAALPLTACVAAPAEPDTGEAHEAMTLGITTRVDFDVDPNGAAIADGTAVDNTYAAVGVHFSSIYCGATASCGPASAYARAGGNASNNGVSLFSYGWPWFDARWGAVEATFDNPGDSVSIDAYALDFVESLSSGPSTSPFLEAYDASGNFLGKVFAPINMGVWQTMTISTGTNNIKRVRFSVPGFPPAAGDHVYAIFDNLMHHQNVELPTIRRCKFFPC